MRIENMADMRKNNEQHVLLHLHVQVAALPLESPDVKEVSLLVDSALLPNEKFCVLTVN